MKKIFKRTIATLLAVIMLFSVIPLSVFAKTDDANTMEGIASNVNMKATNPIGEALLSEYDSSSADERKEYSVTAVSFEGKTATVAFGNAESCKVVVAIYSEEGQMLGSGIKEVEATAGQTDVTIDIASMPQYFLCQVFLLDENNASLCEPLKSVENTEYYEEFMDKTVDDFDSEDIIINFDEQKDDNFAVLADGAVEASLSGNSNLLVSADFDNEIYKFSNIGNDIKNLQPGDIFTYGESNDDLIIVKIKSVSISGTEATIYGDTESEIDDYFDYIKVDIRSTGADDEFTVDSSKADDGVKYLGSEPWDENVIFQTDSFEESDEALFHEDGNIVNIDDSSELSSGVWKIEKKFTENVKLKASIKALITYNFQLHYDAELESHWQQVWGIVGYVDVDYNGYYYCQIQFDNAIKGSVSLSAAYEKELLLGCVGYVTPVGITIGIDFYFFFEISGSVSLTIVKISNTIGFRKTKNEKTVNLCTAPKMELLPSFDTKVSVEIGFNVRPNISFLKLVEVGINNKIGANIEMTLYTTDGNPLTDHLCKMCFPGTISNFYEASLTGKVFFEDYDLLWLKPKFEWETAKFYWSADYNEFGWGLCPHTGSNQGESISDGTGSNDSEFNGTEATGAIINFGSYPQSRVKDTVLIKKLDGVIKNWHSYGYYTSEGGTNDGKMMPSDYMKYADFKYDGNKYRAVTFSKYRTYYICYKSSASNSRQDDNGYYTGNVYYFKYEPLQWKVLDASEGLIVCNKAIDSQAFNNYILYSNGEYYGDSTQSYYASDYGKSSVRDWLNNDFYNTAFSYEQKTKIKGNQTIESKSTYSSKYDGTLTYDNNVFLLSYNDALNIKYGFNSSPSAYDKARQIKSTDYAQCQGCYKTSSRWWLRSSGSSYSASVVGGNGNVGDHNGSFRDIDFTDNAIVPALKLGKTLLSTDSIVETKIRLDETESLTDPVDDINETFSISYSYCLADNDYILLNVLNYREGFKLSTENLLYIDQLTANESGIVNTNFIPKYNDKSSTTLLIGDFGNNVEMRKIDALKVYTAKLMVDGYLYKEIQYNEGQKSLKLPPVPEKIGYTGKWETYSLADGGTVINAIYTIVPKGSVSAISIDNIEISYKSSAKIVPQITIDDGVNYTVKYESSNPSVATVDKNGNISTVHKGSSTITCTVTDEYSNEVKDTCTVNVKFQWWQWLIWILLFGFLWY